MTGTDPVLAAIADLKSHVSSEFSWLDGKIDRLDTTVDQLEVRVGQVDTRVGELDARVGHVQSELGAFKERFDKQPDVRLLGHQMQALIERVSGLEEKCVRALAAINDFARENVTPGEVEALHSELKEVRELEFRHDVRLRLIEDELHLTP